VCERERGGGAPRLARKMRADRRWRATAWAVRCAASTRRARLQAERPALTKPAHFRSARSRQRTAQLYVSSGRGVLRSVVFQQWCAAAKTADAQFCPGGPILVCL